MADETRLKIKGYAGRTEWISKDHKEIHKSIAATEITQL